MSLLLISVGILTQALLAGLFLSGTSGARMIHVVVGALLPYIAIVPMVSAWRRANAGQVPRGVVVGSTVLFIGLWGQEALGHMPFPVSTVIHVPLGVVLFWLASHLAMASFRATRHLASGDLRDEGLPSAHIPAQQITAQGTEQSDG